MEIIIANVIVRKTINIDIFCINVIYKSPLSRQKESKLKEMIILESTV